MSFWSFIASAAGGPILGGAMQLLGTGLSELKDWSASKRRVAEIAALKEKGIALGELEAFTKAQEGTLSSGYKPPENAHWLIHGLFAVAEFTNRMIRPLMVIGACWYVWTRPPEVLGGLQPDILAVSFAVMYFWIGVRHQAAVGGRK